ncbi:hypothetical protein HS041_06900 [Planomonospora sp. ID67723]|uniref:hypothetical protein n=1 Tax=Planomonospora sp. ID67723 TaxID=2738134 RepID=UPI0018C3A80F|nr:hypothetical protein [Planomonospora sp. ID67723]MBG0827488.1 hypothetical protein [Planomonospora sp. ID67723]
MNDSHDELVAVLRPDAFTEDAYRRRREADLARALRPSRAEERSIRRISHRLRRFPMPRPFALIATTAVAGLAAAAIVVPGAFSGDASRGIAPVVGSQTPPAAGAQNLDARSFLLAAAVISEREPDSGRYWYSRVRRFSSVRFLGEGGEKILAVESELSSKLMELVDDPEKSTALVEEYRRKVGRMVEEAKVPFSAGIAMMTEIWQARDPNAYSRHTIEPDKIEFASPEDERKWKEMGSPSLGDLNEKSRTEDLRNLHDYNDKRGIDVQLRMPTDKDALERWLRDAYEREQRPDGTQSPAVFRKTPFTLWVWREAEMLLARPLTSGTRAAFYRVLAEQPGITSLGTVTDPLGRTGTALAMTGFDPWVARELDLGEQVELRMIIDPVTAKLLSSEVRPQGASAPTDRMIFESIGWVDAFDEYPKG